MTPYICLNCGKSHSSIAEAKNCNHQKEDKAVETPKEKPKKVKID